MGLRCARRARSQEAGIGVSRKLRDRLARDLCLLAWCLALAGCGAPLDLGFALAVTVRFDGSIAEADRAAVRSLVVTSSGDEHADYLEPLPLGAAVVETFLYRPGNATRSLELAIEARSEASRIAAGTSGVLELAAGKTTRVEVVLRASSGQPADGGEQTDGGAPADGATIDGGFGPVSTLAFQHADRYASACTGPSETAVADYNGDTRPDVAVSCGTAGSVQVFFGKVDGSFPSTPSATTMLATPTGLAAVDFDGDGHIDLIAVSSDGAHLLKNDDTGHFSDLATRALTGAVRVSVADFDKDGILDVLVSGSATEARVLWGTGVAASAFSTSTLLALWGPPAQADAVDLDNDGYLDVVVLETTAAAFQSLRNTHAATARSFASAATLALSFAPFAAVFADVNGDGKPEGLYAEGSCCSYGFAFLSNTNGVLARSNSATLYNRAGGAVQSMALVDIDHDGVSELAIVTSSGDYLTVFKGLGPLQFDTAAGMTLRAGGKAGRLHAADFDQDGFEDLVLVDGEGFAVAQGRKGARVFAAEVFTFEQGDYFSAMLPLDFDKDGDVDLVAVNSSDGAAYVYSNDGQAKLSKTASLPNQSSFLCGYVNAA